MTKTIAYFLPQFHEIPENNMWWGPGFTEWTNLKRARPLFEGHSIIEPLNDNYYNLLEKDTVIWQTELAKKYSLYGFCYYHYWFKGKKLLEKPAENLLKWNDIDQKFMFMWANHDWTRSWVGGKEILIKQEYGNTNDWKEHIEYLMQFFKDPRYIKVGNKPILLIYITKNIPLLGEMINIWDTECKKNGFDGIFVVDNIRDYKDVRENKFSPGCKAITFQEHQVAFSFYRNNNPIFIFKRILKGVLRKLYIANRIEAIETYDIVVKNSLKVMRKINPNVKTFFSVCLGWDNTPRYGENGYVLSKVTPEKFKKYLAKTEEYSTKYDQEFIFIACWNEWCEGMVLEPTKKDGYKYLDAIKEVYNLNKDLNL
jgi:hypothetical protein